MKRTMNSPRSPWSTSMEIKSLVPTRCWRMYKTFTGWRPMKVSRIFASAASSWSLDCKGCILACWNSPSSSHQQLRIRWVWSACKNGKRRTQGERRSNRYPLLPNMSDGPSIASETTYKWRTIPLSRCIWEMIPARRLLPILVLVKMVERRWSLWTTSSPWQTKNNMLNRSLMINACFAMVSPTQGSVEIRLWAHRNRWMQPGRLVPASIAPGWDTSQWIRVPGCNGKHHTRYHGSNFKIHYKNWQPQDCSTSEEDREGVNRLTCFSSVLYESDVVHLPIVRGHLACFPRSRIRPGYKLTR